MDFAVCPRRAPRRVFESGLYGARARSRNGRTVGGLQSAVSALGLGATFRVKLEHAMAAAKMPSRTVAVGKSASREPLPQVDFRSAMASPAPERVSMASNVTSGKETCLVADAPSC